MERRAAVAQADVLDRGQLVEAGCDDRSAGDVRPGAIPGERAAGHGVHGAEDAIREQAVCGPRRQVARDEDPRRHE